MNVAVLPHTLNRTVVIGAPRELVFNYFTDDARWAAWWGAGSTIDARPGGKVYIRHPNGVEAGGDVVEVARPERIVFTYGFMSGTPMPPGTSRVTIRLAPHDAGTELTLVHDFAESGPRDHHVQGWRYQLALFSNIVADEVHGDAARAVDAWFRVWSIADASERERSLAAIASPSLRFRDRFGATDGIADLVPHIGAAQQFMPGMTLSRSGDVRHCQGTVLAEWTAAGPDGQARGAGTNVFVFGPDGRVASVTGFWKA
jgi:uncharacterized protein YndB with AHSA1/START domain